MKRRMLMMNKNLKNQKGITLISLTITVIILTLITGIIIYNARDSIYIRNYTYLENDIQNLRDMVSNYYSINGKIPAKIKYTNTENIERIISRRQMNSSYEITFVGC